jgi:hypothetical protein
MEIRQLHASHPVFDIEDAIIRAGNCPSPVDLKPWQDRIDQITGKTVTGLSRLRIEWGQDIEGAGGAWICGARRAKYPFWRYEEGGSIRDIGTPRFYVSELHTNAELRKDDHWEKTRYYFDPQLGWLDVLGPLPEDGFYTAVFTIALHDEACCNGTGVLNNDICLGAYRPPCDEDIDRIRRMKYRRDHASNQDIRPSQSRIEKLSDEMEQKRDERIDRESRAYIDDFFGTHGWKITTDDESKLRWGKYIFLGAHSKSGATVEQIKQWRKEKAINARSSADNGDASQCAGDSFN